MTEKHINYLQSIINNWLNNGAPCTTSLKPYERSSRATYNSGRRRKRSKHKPYQSQIKKQSNPNHLTRISKQTTMIQMCEDFLRNNRELLNI